MPSPILKGRTKSILVKNGNATIKNILKNDTRHFIEEDIFLNKDSFFISVSVSWRNADVFQVAKASIHNDIKIDPTRKYQKLSQTINIKLDKTKNILLNIIIVLFHNLSHNIPAGI
ncbi:TPA: hypothetical protein DIC40_00180 [Patescibacteria group bacterium]|nr:hypothetical protein [Candidatus Gracilibacteria bacterium]